MPVPSPKKNESKQKFVSRCAKLMADRDPEMDNKKRVAVCYSAWRKKNEKSE